MNLLPFLAFVLLGLAAGVAFIWWNGPYPPAEGGFVFLAIFVLWPLVAVLVLCYVVCWLIGRALEWVFG